MYSISQAGSLPGTSQELRTWLFDFKDSVETIMWPSDASISALAYN